MAGSSSRIAGAVRAVRGPRRVPIPSRAPIALTPSAVSRVKELLDKCPSSQALRIGVRQRGCNGLTYTLDYAEKKATNDEEVVQDGVKIFIASKAQLTLLGTEMDFVRTKLSEEFVFNNPNVKGTCGCGESFTV